MTPLEVFAILVLAGAIVILLYYYLQDNRKLNLGRMKSDATNLGERVYGRAGDPNVMRRSIAASCKNDLNRIFHREYQREYQTEV